jgi:hypothetical protein
MMTLNYRIAGLSLQGRTTAGRQVITMTVSHIQLAQRSAITHTEAQVSFDGGKTWHQAQDRSQGGGRFRVVFTAPRSAQVSLRVSTHDAPGNSLTETIYRAYQTSA